MRVSYIKFTQQKESFFVFLHKILHLLNNKNMNWTLWSFVAGTLFFTLIFVLPLNIKAKVVYDVLKNEGKLQLKLFKLTIFYYSLKVQKGFLELRSIKKGKILLVPLIFDDKGQFEQTDFAVILLKTIYVEHGTIYVNFGAKTDAFVTAMVIGCAKALASILGAVTKSKKKESRIKNKVYACFNKDKFLICLKASIKISILQVVNCYFKSIIGKKKHKKEMIKNEQ